MGVLLPKRLSANSGFLVGDPPWLSVDYQGTFFSLLLKFAVLVVSQGLGNSASEGTRARLTLRWPGPHCPSRVGDMKVWKSNSSGLPGVLYMLIVGAPAEQSKASSPVKHFRGM